MAITVKNINEYAGSDISDTWWSTWIGSYLAGKLGSAIANGDDSGMGKLSGIANLALTIPDIPDVNLGGDAGVEGTVKGRPTATPTGVLTAEVSDQIFSAAISNLKVVAEGPDDIMIDTMVGLVFNPIMFVINKPGASREAGTYGQRGYNVRELFYGFVHDKDVEAIGRTVVGNISLSIAFQHIDRTPYGEQILEAKFGSCKLFGFKTYWSQYPVTYHSYLGDGSDASFVLDVTPAFEDGEALQGWEAGVGIIYATDYAVVKATKTVTFETGMGPAEGVMAVFKVKYLPTVC